MKVKKIIALVASAAMVGVTAAAGGVAAASAQSLQVPQLKIDQTKVVLPTIPEVNGVPLQIKDDAATAVSLVQEIYSKSVYSALQAFEDSLVPVSADQQVSNYVTDGNQLVTLASDNSLAPIVFGTVIYNSNGKPVGVDVNGDGIQDYPLIQDSNGNWYVDFNKDGQVDSGDIPVTIDAGFALRSNFNPNAGGADIDLNDHFYIAQLQIPFASSMTNLYVNGNPVDKVYFGIDFSRINYIDPNATGLSALEKAHLGEWELKSGAIVLAYPLKYSPLKPSTNDVVVPSKITLQNGDQINVLYYYNHLYPGTNSNGKTELNVGDALSLGNWKFLVDDISTDGTSAYVYITAPNGQEKQFILPISSAYYVIGWIDSNGDFQYEITDLQGMYNKLGELLADGITDISTFSVQNKFIGIDNTQIVDAQVNVYQLKKTYKDGENLSEIVPAFENIPDANQWYLKINVNNPQEPIVEFVWMADYTGAGKYPATFLQPGEKIAIPVPYFKEVQTDNGTDYELVTQEIDFTLNDQKDQKGYWDPTTAKFYVYYLKDKDNYYKANTVDSSLNLVMKKIKSYDPSAAIMTDQELDQADFQPGYDYVIIGGWVSNAAWKLLEKYYPDQVKDMKAELMNDLEQGKPGFVLKVLPNPADPNHVVIVAAGTDHEQTRAAVQVLMEILNGTKE